VLFKAYSLLPAQEAQPLNQTWAVVLSLLSIVVLKQKISFRRILAILISFIGVLIIATRGHILNLKFASITGVILALLSAFIWSVYWICNLKDNRDETVKLFLNFLGGSLMITIYTIAFDKLPPLKLPVIASAVYIGFFEMGFTFVLWLRALKYSKTTAQISNSIYLVPFLSLIIIRIALREPILISTIVGLLFIIAGIALQQVKRRCSLRRRAGGKR
jgi:drug/metabolite transporter (DMT)-like permease